MFALTNAVLHTSISVTGRVWMRLGVSSAELTTDAFFLMGVIFMIVHVFYALAGGYLPP